MEITIKINGRMVSVEVSAEVAEYMDAERCKVENLSHKKRRYWDDQEFDEYIIATEGLLPYQSLEGHCLPAGNSGFTVIHSGHLHNNSVGSFFALCAIRLQLLRNRYAVRML